MPQWALIGTIVVPLVAIAALAIKMTAGSGEEEGALVDPTARLQELEAQVRGIEGDYRKLQALRRAEDPATKRAQETLIDRINSWMDDWDRIFASKRDSEGRLPADLQGYQPVRSKVNQIRVDLLKSSGF